MRDLQIYCDEMEAQIKEWDAKFERLKVKGMLAEGEAQIEIGDEIGFLRIKKRAVEEKLQELREATGEACVLVKEEMQAALDDLETSFANALSRLK
jgi:predicted transcriptional regulator